jgi:hypothetical protein
MSDPGTPQVLVTESDFEQLFSLCDKQEWGVKIKVEHTDNARGRLYYMRKHFSPRFDHIKFLAVPGEPNSLFLVKRVPESPDPDEPEMELEVEDNAIE